MYKFFLWCSKCLFFLLISSVTQAQNNNPRRNGDIPDTIVNRGLILKEVVIKASPKVVVKRDTVLFSADAFMDNSVKVVEDLLKKIPGIDIAKDGSITINGKKAERILIEGDDLFKKDYTVLSRNLSASLIDKVQVIDNYTDNALLKGLTSNDNKVINLTLKDKRKKMLFGDISAGIGTADRQDVSGNLISFTNKSKIFFLGNYNTTGRNPMPDIANQSGVAVMNNLINYTENISLINIYRLHSIEVSPEKINFNKARLISSFVSHTPCPNLTVRFSGWSFLDNNTFTQQNNYRYYLQDSAIAINEYNFYSKRPISTAINIDINYKCTKRSELKLSCIFNSIAAVTTADMLSNGTFYYNRLKDHSLNRNNTLTYTKRINNTNALVVETIFSNHTGKQNLSIKQNSARYLPFAGLFTDSLYQSISYPSKGVSLFCHYIHAKKSWRMNVDVGTAFHSQYLHSSLDTLDFAKQTKSISDSFSNKEQLKRYNSTISFSISKQINMLQFTASLAGNFSQNRFTSNSQHQPFRYLLISNYLYPSFGMVIKWKVKRHTILANYSYDTKFTDITDIYGGYIFTDYRSLQKGMNFFSHQPLHTVSLGYTCSYLPKQLLGYFTISRISINKIPFNNLQLSEQYDIITRMPSSSAMTYFLYAAGIDKFINALNGGMKIKTLVSINKYQDALNGVNSRQIRSLGSVTQLSFRSVFRGIFNYNVGAILDYSRSKTMSNQAILFQNHSITNFLDLYFKVSDKLHATINNERYYFNAISNGKKSYYFIDLSLQYEMIKSKLSFMLTGKNLTNNKIYIFTQVTDYSIQMQQYSLVPLYLLLQLNYRF